MMAAALEDGDRHYPYHVSPEYLNTSNYTNRSFFEIHRESEDFLHDPFNVSFVYWSSNNGTEKISTDTFNFIQIICITVWVISILGAVGNGTVIWLLGFRIKRNPFMTFILNLAAADFGALLAAMLYSIATYIMCKNIYINRNFIKVDTARNVFFFPFLLMYTASQFLLTAISIDRCVAVFFPLWHKCERPPRLSIIVCGVIWVLSFLLTDVTCILYFLHPKETGVFYQFIMNAVLCLPVITIATVSLFIKFCSKAQQHRRGRLLMVILLALLFFLLFAFPYNVIYILHKDNYFPAHISLSAFLLACLNSSVNPVIYFLAGRRWKSRRRESMKMVLQKVFKEEEDYAEKTPVKTQI